jgi:hypothetical protein
MEIDSRAGAGKSFQHNPSDAMIETGRIRVGKDHGNLHVQ